MDVCKDTNVCSDNIIWDDLLNLDSLESYEDLQTRFSELHETYLKEIENSKKVKKNLEKLIKHYSKLCKKFEAQKKVIEELKTNIQEKMGCLKESYQNQERLKGLINVYKTERSCYASETNLELRREKNMLLDICCQLINESVRTNNIRNITNVILRKFKNDLNDDKLNLLKGSQHSIKKEAFKIDESLHNPLEDLKIFSLLNNHLLDKVKKIDELELKKEKSLSPTACGLEEENVTCQQKTGLLNVVTQTPSIDKMHISSENELILNAQSNKEAADMCNSFTDLVPDQRDELEGEHEFKSSKKRDLDSVHDKASAVDLPSLEVNVEKIFSKSGLFEQSNKNCDKSFKTNSNNINNCYDNNDTENSQKTDSVSTDCNKISSRTREIENKITFNAKPNNVFCTSRSEVLEKSEKNSGNSSSYVRERVNNFIYDKDDEDERQIARPQTFKDCHAKENKKELTNEEPKTTRLETKEEVAVAKTVNLLNGLPEEEDDIITNNNICDDVFEKPQSNFSCSNDANNKTESIFDIRNDVREVSNHVENESIDMEVAFETAKVNPVEVSATILSEEELSRIFSEMTSVRLLSPIKDVIRRRHASTSDVITSRPATPSRRESHSMVRSSTSWTGEPFQSSKLNWSFDSNDKKRNGVAWSENRSKKFKVDDESSKIESGTAKKEETNQSGFLDSILSAMSIQNKEFKSNEFHERDPPMEKSLVPNLDIKDQTYTNQCTNSSNFINMEPLKSETEANSGSQAYVEKKTLGKEILIKKRLESFVSAIYSNEEESNKSVKDCIMLFDSCPVEMIARVIVEIVLTNVNEEVVPRERPVPALTKTQSHLITLLTVFKTHDLRCDSLISLIMSKISEKLFPDRNFWPDDSVETATRFYIALCKHRNDVGFFWKFCLQAMAEMKQRCCLVVFVALKTWPDALHHASSIQNNIVAVTAVNIFLHMPKENRTLHQNKMLLALKHFLQNFYGYKVDDTIENYTGKLLNSFFGRETGANKSIILMSKCRDVAWTVKNILPKLLSSLTNWTSDGSDEDMVHQVLKILHQILPNLLLKNKSVPAEVTKTISCFSEILNSQKLNHESEQKIIEILLQLKQISGARKIIREWIPKKPIDENLKNEIVNVSAENILRELNRSKDEFGKSAKKKKKKKTKGKGKGVRIQKSVQAKGKKKAPSSIRKNRS